MSEKLNLRVFSILFVFSLFLLGAISNAGGGMPPMPVPMPYEPKSNCCLNECDVWKEGVGYICGCDYTIGDLGQNAEVICEMEIPTGDDDGWDSDDDDSFAGCDDSTCENQVCQIDPTCCQEMKYIESGKYVGGWNENCAIIANQICDVCGGSPIVETEIDSDGDPFQLYSFMDLRDRKTFVQVTNVSSSPVTVHVQVLDVNNNCNENNFFDVYTGNDTHVYDMSNITTNDGKPAGFVLPDNAYGMVIVTVVTGIGGQTDENSVLVGNFRILDEAGYEYRTNMLGIRSLQSFAQSRNLYFNYNIKDNVTLSDVVGISVLQDVSNGGVIVSPQNTFAAFDIDIFNTNEVPFSCRDIIFACIDDDSPLVEQLLQDVGVGSVASFEYGINNAIPHSRGGELLCPGNVIPDGFVVMRPESREFDNFVGYVGLNNGNGRGSMDSLWEDNYYTSFQEMLIAFE